MEKQEANDGIMEVEAKERQGDLGSSNDKDNCQRERQLLQNDMEILLGSLPAEVWVAVMKTLLARNCTDDLVTLSNASPYFRDLMLSKRVLFLFPKVLKIIGPQLENEERVNEAEKSSILTCRSVCRSWNKSVDEYIDASGKPDFFRLAPPQPRDPAIMNARYKYFGHMAPQRHQQFLNYFDQSHQPDSRHPRNPFIGTTVTLGRPSPFSLLLTKWQHCFYIDNLLQKYGQHIRVMSLGVQLPTRVEIRRYFWLKECLQLTPNLTHLKVQHQPDDKPYYITNEVDTYFGEHAYRTIPIAEFFRQRVLNELGALREDALQQIINLQLEMQERLLQLIPMDERQQHSYVFDEAFVLSITHVLWAALRIGDGIVPLVKILNDMDYSTAITEHPLPMLKDLECLKLCKLSAILFNPLIQSYREKITWLHIQPLGLRSGTRRYLDWWTLDFPKLKKLYISFPGGSEEVRRLRDIHPSFLSLTSLHFEYPSVREYMGWAEIFLLLEQNWGSTLTELKIRLPVPRNEKDKKNVRIACEHGRLVLPKLKRLMMWKSGLSNDADVIRNFHFLDPVREDLEEFVVFSY